MTLRFDDEVRAELDRDFGRLADGDRNVLEKVFTRLSPLVRSFCERLVDSREAEDVAQMALEKLFSQASEYEKGRPVVPWVLAIAAWECRTARTRRRRSRETTLDFAETMASTHSPEAELDRTEWRRALAEIVSTLSPGDQEALWTALDEDRPLSPTERKRKQRAFDRLRMIGRKLYGW